MEYRNGERNAGNARNRGNAIFRRMSTITPGNVAKHSEQCPPTFRGISPNIPGNVAKHSEECPQTFQGMS